MLSRCRAVLRNQFVDGHSVAAGKDLEAAIPQRKRQELGNFRGIVNEQDPPHANGGTYLTIWRRVQLV